MQNALDPARPFRLDQGAGVLGRQEAGRGDAGQRYEGRLQRRLHRLDPSQIVGADEALVAVSVEMDFGDLAILDQRGAHLAGHRVDQQFTVDVAVHLRRRAGP